MTMNADVTPGRKILRKDYRHRVGMDSRLDLSTPIPKPSLRDGYNYDSTAVRLLIKSH